MKEFNITGTCFHDRHYMVNTNDKINQIMDLINKGKYFVINRPRQYGKTTTLYSLEQEMLKGDEYLPVSISFEGIDDSPFESKELFASFFMRFLSKEYNIKKFGYSSLFKDKEPEMKNMETLSNALSEVLDIIGKKVVLMIDEVDKLSNNQLFLHFLGMLREKFLRAQARKETTFHSVIFAGVHDIKTLKLKIRPDEARTLNSPWNIAIDFKIDMSFNQGEIASMLKEYCFETGNTMDIDSIAKQIHHWTSGYPFLVSKICKIIDEDFIPARENKTWVIDDVNLAVKMILNDTNTLFDDMAKNLENNKFLYDFMKSLLMGRTCPKFELINPTIHFANMYGLIKCDNEGKAIVHNKIFDEKITSYFISKEKTETGNLVIKETIQSFYIKPDGKLDMDAVVKKFQKAVKEKYAKSDFINSPEFVENELRLLFLVFIDPILNGKGFSFKEVQIGAEKRLDIIVVFAGEKFIVELKIWYGPQYHAEGIKRMKEYMKAESVKKGYMIIANKTKQRTFESKRESGILMIYI